MKSPATHFVFALIIAILASRLFGIWYATISNMSAAAAQVQNQIAGANENVQRIASARAALTEIAGDEASVRSHFVSEEGVVAFVNDLEARGHAQGVTVSVRSVSKDTVSSGPVLLVALSLEGTFDAVMRTIGAIEYAPYAVSVSALSVEQGAADAWHADLNLTVGSSPVQKATL